ncbi:MAG: tyrosine-type recombinase/integrase [Syntrophobacteraceae bacterium]
MRGRPSSDPESGSIVAHLDNAQIEQLTEAFRAWFDSAPSAFIRRVRGRYYITFLLLRFTGARISEILSIDDTVDIDFRQGEIRITLTEEPTVRRTARSVPVPGDVLSDIIAYLSEFPNMRGRVLALDQGNFRREFYRRAEEANIPRGLSHPHILRHTRAMELLRAGVPLTIVQDLLGHALASTTAVYLERIEVTAEKILREKGLL